MIGEVTGIVVEEEAMQAGTDAGEIARGKEKEMMDPLLEMIAGRSRCVTTAGTTIAEEIEEDQEDQDGKRTHL